MIDKLQRVAQTIQILRLPSIAVGVFGLATVIVIIFTSRSHEGDKFLIPGIICLLWAISTYTFIVTFRSVPEKGDQSLKFLAKLKRSATRAWYFFIGYVFIGTTLTAVWLSLRMIVIWLRDYGG
jgi:hypothetical protein